MGNVSVGLRLFGSLVVTSLIALAIGLIGYQGMRQVVSVLAGVTDVTLPCVAGLGMVKEGLLAAQSAERTILVPELANSKEYDRQREALDKALALVDAGRSLVDGVPLDAEEAVQWKLFNDALGDWRKTNAQVAAFVSQNKRSNALTLSIGTSMIAMRKATAAVNVLLERSRQQAEALSGEMRMQADRRALVLFAAVAACVALSVALGAVVALSISRPLRKGVAFARAVADGDLHACLDVKGRDEIGVLADALRRMLEALKENIAAAERRGEEAETQAQKAHEAVLTAERHRQAAESARKEGMFVAARRLADVVEVLTGVASQLGERTRESSQGAAAQSDRLSETVVAVGQMTGTVRHVAQSASTASRTAAEAREKAAAGSLVVRQVVGGIGTARDKALALTRNMAVLGEQAEGIGRVLGVISDIADQTNLLALNAAIEAARAGESGRGFAVVADEVRKLAEKTMTATAEVGQAIRDIQDGTRKSVEGVRDAVSVIESATDLADQSGQALEAIVALVEAASDQVRAIAEASGTQSAASQAIESAIADVSRLSDETARAMERSAATVEELSGQTCVLRELVEELRGERAMPSALSAE